MYVYLTNLSNILLGTLLSFFAGMKWQEIGLSSSFVAVTLFKRKKILHLFLTLSIYNKSLHNVMVVVGF